MQGSTQADDATLTEYLAASDPGHPEIDGPCKITHVVGGLGTWVADDGEQLDDDPDEYRAECSCGETFGSWGKATRHVGEQH